MFTDVHLLHVSPPRIEYVDMAVPMILVSSHFSFDNLVTLLKIAYELTLHWHWPLPVESCPRAKSELMLLGRVSR
jgi:hypothetical protein